MVFEDGVPAYPATRWLRFPWSAYNQANGELWPAVANVDADDREECLLGIGTYPASRMGPRGPGFVLFPDRAGLDSDLLGPVQQRGWSRASGRWRHRRRHAGRGRNRTGPFPAERGMDARFRRREPGTHADPVDPCPMARIQRGQWLHAPGLRGSRGVSRRHAARGSDCRVERLKEPLELGEPAGPAVLASVLTRTPPSRPASARRRATATASTGSGRALARTRAGGTRPPSRSHGPTPRQPDRLFSNCCVAAT